SVESEAPLVAWVQAGMDGDPHRLPEAASGMRPWILHRTAAIAWRHRDYELAREAGADFDRLDRDEPVTRVLAGLARAYATRQAGPARCVQPIAESEGASPLVAECLTVRGYLGEDTLPEARDAWRRIGGRLRVSEIAAFLGEPAPERLTRREGELVELVQAGHGNQAIAGILHLSIKTVEAYLTRIYAKTGCTSRLELAAAAAEGRLPPSDK
ncbi:MAG TPA: LuxR C-terminal-related transcriptional regulator, partial [Mycobacteriales bacterium]|nr:LuxR C-terminal-related transcriptional regulator [Mycobacteriales bacterium]